jgi:glycosyltransferase EpsD
MSMNGKKVLFVANIMPHFTAFHVPFIRWLTEQGCEVHAAANGTDTVPYCARQFNIPVERSPYRTVNIRACRMLKQIIDEGGYDLVHCHTPMGGVLARLAARDARRRGTKVLYTAHGFHFYKGAPLQNWLVYYPAEKYLARFTDGIVTINREDYERAKRHHFCGRLYLVPGMGVDPQKFMPAGAARRSELRGRFGFAEDDFLLLCVGELNGNKNQAELIDAMVKVVPYCPHVKLLLAGKGSLQNAVERDIAERSLQKNVILLGYRRDVPELLPMCDLGVSASRREGLPINVIESLMCGLPVLVSDNRGHREMLENNVNGFICRSSDEFAERILQLAGDHALYNRLAAAARSSAMKFCISDCVGAMARVYREFL